MMNYPALSVLGCLLVGACSTATQETTASLPAQAAESSYQMDVTDIDYGSMISNNRFLVSYSFPDASGRFAVMSTAQSGAAEPVEDTSEFKTINDDVAASIICKDGLRKLDTRPTYVVADRSYQSTYACNVTG